MRFGRVDGFLRQLPDGALDLTVNLETGGTIAVVRSGPVTPLREIVTIDDLTWHADQYTQETIAVDLAEQGWEVFAAGETPTQNDPSLIRSTGYLVRQAVY